MTRRFSLFLILLLLASPAAAQVTLDAVANDGGSNSAASSTFSHTVTGSNLYLIVACHTSTITVSSVTYNLVAMASIGSDVGNDGGTRIDVWGLKAPATGTHSVIATFSGLNNEVCISASFTGVDQTTPIGTVVHDGYSASGASHTHNTTSVTNGLVWDAFTLQTAGSTITTNGGQTTRSGPTSTTGVQGVASSKPGAASVTTGYSWPNDFNRWAHVTVPLAPAAGAASSCGRLGLLGVGC